LGPTEPLTRVGLRFLSLRIDVETNVGTVVSFCRDLYGRFLDSRGEAACTLRVEQTGAESFRVRDSAIDATFQDSSWTTGIVAARLLEAVGNRVDTHDLFHGAALSRGGRGLILSGESGFGKSVLTLSLVRRGWKFLSDEIAVVDANGPQLSPFPKAIEIRTEAARLVGLTSEQEVRRSGKFLQDPDVLFPGCLSQPCPLEAVVFLAAQEDQPADVRTDTLRLTVHRKAPDLDAALRGMTGVRRVGWESSDGGLHTLVIHHEPSCFEAWQLDEVLGRQGVLIVASSADERPPADFEAEPRLESMAKHAGVNMLLGRFRGRRAFARRIESSEEGFGELFFSLLTRLKDVQFYRLRVGRLEQSLELLERTLA
jgi:hypothetical protein